jgi:hypothetical protein
VTQQAWRVRRARELCIRRAAIRAGELVIRTWPDDPRGPFKVVQPDSHALISHGLSLDDLESRYSMATVA